MCTVTTILRDRGPSVKGKVIKGIEIEDVPHFEVKGLNKYVYLALARWPDFTKAC